MNLQFLPSSNPPEHALPHPGIDLYALRRPLGVTLAATLAALLHGAVLFWYLERPAPAPPTQAMPLPMIEIALAAPGAPKAAEPPRPLPKKKPKVVKKIQSKVKALPKKSEIAPEKPSADTQENLPATPAAPAPAAGNAGSTRTETFTPANTHADYLDNPRPVYPALARRRHWEGRVLLKVFVTAEGHSGEVSVSRSSGREVLDEAAQDAVRKWRFVPARRGEVAESSWVTVPIEFVLR